MGFLLVFFPPHDKQHNLLSRRANSNIALLSKAQSTISICAFLFFLTFLVFTLSTFEPTKPVPKPKTHRFLLLNPSHALHRMGTLYRRGTKPMNDVVLSHVAEDTSQQDFRLFLRMLHRSGVTSKCDVVFLFANRSMTLRFAPIIREENDSFSSLVQLNLTRSESSFDLTRFLRGLKKTGEPIWGKRIRSNASNSSETGEGELTRLSYGSVVSFDASELDPENSLAGFFYRVPLSLRRWACYPMLLGRVRRNFKHVMLVDVKNVVVFNDPLGRVRNRSPEAVFLYAKHGKKNSVKTHLVNSAVIMGGARGVRRLSNVMLVEIVRAAMQHKKKNSVSESVILSQLVRNEFLLKNVDLIDSRESIPETSSLGGSTTTSFKDYVMIQRGMGNYDLNSVIMKQICSSVVDSSVYRDC